MSSSSVALASALHMAFAISKLVYAVVIRVGPLLIVDNVTALQGYAQPPLRRNSITAVDTVALMGLFAIVM